MTTRRWRWYLVAWWAALMLIVGLSLTSACIKVPPNLSPVGRVAFTADQVVLRINELQRAAIQANVGGGLDPVSTRLIVEFSVAADKVLKATPAGWQATVAAAWAETKMKLPPITNPAIQAALSAVDVALAATIGGTR